MQTTRIHIHKQRRGSTAIEFALVLPVLMLCVLGVVDYARIYSTSVTLNNAARVGAEQGATHRLTPRTQAAWEARVLTAVLEEMQSVPNFNAAQLNTNWTSSTNANGELVIEVTTRYPFQSLVNWPGLPSTVTLRASVAMEQFR